MWFFKINEERRKLENKKMIEIKGEGGNKKLGYFNFTKY